jgi:polyisoprenyl-phosphate glycosyltransferase
MSSKSLSIVIPCHNEEEVIGKTHETLAKLAGGLREEGLISDYELVMVNNGSTDATLAHMVEIFNQDARVVVVDLKTNCGYQSSISAGIHHASMDMVVTIDADLQDDPLKIREMIQKHREGYELVLGIRSDRSSDTVLKRLTAGLYYRLLGALGVKSIPQHGDFRLMSRSLVDDFKKFPERNRYLRSMIFDLESRYGTVYYKRSARSAGISKFSPTKLIGLALDGITSYSSKPVHLVFMLGLFMFLFSIVGLLYVLLIKIYTDRSVPGWAFISAVLLFFFGLQNLSIGIIGEYLAKVYTESKQRPLYLVRRIYRSDKSPGGEIPRT